MMQIFSNVSSAPYCVYGHYVAGVCVYVGSGYLKRAFEFDRDRSETHREVTQSEEISVTIFTRCSTRSEAIETERNFILTMQPRINRQHVGVKLTTVRKQASAELKRQNNEMRAKLSRERRAAKHKRSQPIMCHQTGQYFYGPRHAGRALSKCPARISATVRGICRSVDGLTFRKATWEETGFDRDLIGRPKAQDAAPSKFIFCTS